MLLRIDDHVCRRGFERWILSAIGC